MVNRAIKYQRIPFVVTVAGEVVPSGAITVDINYKTVSGILAISKDAARTAMDGLTFEKFEINNQEIYPEGFDVEILGFGRDTNVNERFEKDVNEPGQNSSVDIKVKDGSIVGQVYPYTVFVVLKLSNPVQ